MKTCIAIIGRFFLGCLLLSAATAVAAPADRAALHMLNPGVEMLHRLQHLEGVVDVQEIPACGEFYGKFEVTISQLLDPHDPAAGVFRQRILVMHAGSDRPTVLITQGYNADFALREEYRDELSALFGANIVLVEHRYFGRSVPDSLSWKYLTAENSAYDLHRVRELFGKMYPGKWIASGISKGGTTTMLYAAYFPDDVDIYVPYVGPLCRSVEDKRFTPYLKNVGTAAERDAVKAVQIELFRRKESLLPAFEALCAEKGYEFRVPVSEIYDYCVLEYAFSFWQWRRTADQLPALDASDRELLDDLCRNAGPDYFDLRSPLAAFFVQAARELGYYPYDLKPFRKYTSLRTTRNYLRRIFLPEELLGEKFSDELYKKISNYLKENDPRMMMIYGGDDPWTAPGAAWLVTGAKRNMRVYTAPGGGHRTRIGTLPEVQRDEAVATLRGWLED